MKNSKEAMMNKAIALFKEKGFDGVTIDMICQACGVTKGSFYHHFKSKNEVLLNFYEATPANALLRAGELLSLSSPRQQLWRLLEFEIDRTVALGPDLLHHMLLLDIQRGNTLLNPYAFEQDGAMREYSRLYSDIIERGQEAGEIRPGKPADLLFAYISGLLGVAMNWSARGGEYDEKEELYRLFTIIF